MSDPLGSVIRTVARYPAAILAKTSITPNQITFAGFLVNCVVAYLIAFKELSLIAIGLLIWIAGFFDALDGGVARIKGVVSTFGNFWDSVLDRYSDSVIYLGILIYFLRTGHTDHVVLIVVAIVGSLAISYVRAKAESLGQKCEVGLMPRTVRIIVLGASFCLGQVFWGILLIAVLSHLTVAQRIYYVYKNIS